MKAYGFPVKDTSEAECVAALMERYQKLTGQGPSVAAKPGAAKGRRRKAEKGR